MGEQQFKKVRKGRRITCIYYNGYGQLRKQQKWSWICECGKEYQSMNGAKYCCYPKKTKKDISYVKDSFLCMEGGKLPEWAEPQEKEVK